MKKIQLTWIAVVFILAAVAGATFVFFGSSWNGPEKGVVLERSLMPFAVEPVKSSDTCRITNCHGLEIDCGSGAPEFCTMEYQIGDNCRQYAKCGIIGGQCQQLVSPEFTKCSSCVAKCNNDFANDSAGLFECDSKCSRFEVGKDIGANNAEISRRRSIIESFYPKLENFEEQVSFAGQRVKAVVDGADYYFAYITEGSGVPIVAAKCFKVDADYKLYFIGDMSDSSIAGDENYTDIDPVECEGVKIPLSSETVLSETECADCGNGGWEKMNYGCGAVIDKESFKKCLEGFDWFKGQVEVDAAKIIDGYIEIGSMEILDSSAANTIKVMIYRQWAVDKEGNLYLLGQLG